jgi:hypothetical protein
MVVGKIFISYRREDTAANALGISQYLEKEFGRKNVFIDVDMAAGAKFPSILETRLAQCKVMLALIGPDWLNLCDEQGRRRLDDPDDWVRLEIAHGLRRDITVIPVRVGGANLPPRTELPEDIRGLVDHQAVSITIPGFRHEMSGLARDIKAIPSRKSRWRFGMMMSVGLLLLLIMLALILVSTFPSSFERIRETAFPRPLTTRLSKVWNSQPGEWVVYSVDMQPIAYYFKPSSIQVFGEHIAFTARYPFKRPPSDQTSFQSAYEDDTNVIDCKRSVSALAETTIYNSTGEIVSHYTKGEPKTLDLSSAAKIPPGSVLANGAYVFCNDKLRPSLAGGLATATLYDSPVLKGEAEMYHSAPKKVSDESYEFILVTKFVRDQPYANLFPGQEVLGLPLTYRTTAQLTEMNCAEKKVTMPKTEYFDSDDIFTSLGAPLPVPTMDVKDGTVLAMLFSKVCDANVRNVGGKYEGTSYTSLKAGGQGDYKISISIEQTGNKLKISFQTPNGGQGEGTGVLEGNTVKAISLKSTAQNCPGSYEGSVEFTDDGSINWSFKGQDCTGLMEGHGTAKKTKV